MQTDISVDTKQQTLQGVAFPVHKDAVAALERFRDKKINYVQLVSFKAISSTKVNCVNGLIGQICYFFFILGCLEKQ